MTYSFHPEAEDEFNYAIDYYEDCERGLGYDFALEVYSTIGNIIKYPKAWTQLDGNIHRCQTKRFPYGIIYCIENTELLILAVMHLHRNPNYWKDRIA